jgi:hypothetical protein
LFIFTTYFFVVVLGVAFVVAVGAVLVLQSL